MKYQAVLFDFDYTLGDSTEPIVGSATAALCGMGYPAPEREQVRLTIGLTLEDGYTFLTGDAREENRREFFRRFKAHAKDIMAGQTKLCPGARELLSWLKEQGIPFGIVSTKGGEMLDDIFRRQELRDWFSLIIGGQDVSAAKPDPEGLNLALNKLSKTGGQVLFCGDTVIDAETALRAGVDFCAVLNGTTPASAFEKYPYVNIAQDLPALLAWLQENK